MKSLKNRRSCFTCKIAFFVTFFVWSVIFSGCSKEDSKPVIEYGSVSDIENNSYKTVKIGNQTWMAENLKTTRLANGNPITFIDTIVSLPDWQNSATAAYTWYNFGETDSVRAVYGALYNWYTVKSNYLCPAGWHIPSDAEWNELKTFVGGESVYLGIKNIAAGKLKETDTIHWDYPNNISTNETGFTALPGGWLKWNGSFFDIGKMGVWWSSSESDKTRAWYFELSGDYSPVNLRAAPKYSGLSVRCVKD